MNEIECDRQTLWDKRYLALCQVIASWSKDPSTKVGACIVRHDRTLVSLGFNGFPRGMEDRPEWLMDAQERHLRTVHAEQNALDMALENVGGFTLYSTVLPCPTCALRLIQRRIGRVVCFHTTQTRTISSELYDRSRLYFRDTGIRLLEF